MKKSAISPNRHSVNDGLGIGRLIEEVPAIQ